MREFCLRLPVLALNSNVRFELNTSHNHRAHTRARETPANYVHHQGKRNKTTKTVKTGLAEVK